MVNTSLTLIATISVGLITTKAWCDIMAFMYYRERMHVYRSVIGEGMSIIRLAIEKGALSDLKSNVETCLQECTEGRHNVRTGHLRHSDTARPWVLGVLRGLNFERGVDTRFQFLAPSLSHAAPSEAPSHREHRNPLCYPRPGAYHPDLFNMTRRRQSMGVCVRGRRWRRGVWVGGLHKMLWASPIYSRFC